MVVDFLGVLVSIAFLWVTRRSESHRLLPSISKIKEPPKESKDPYLFLIYRIIFWIITHPSPINGVKTGVLCFFGPVRISKTGDWPNQTKCLCLNYGIQHILGLNKPLMSYCWLLTPVISHSGPLLANQHENHQPSWWPPLFTMIS